MSFENDILYDFLFEKQILRVLYTDIAKNPQTLPNAVKKPVQLEVYLDQKSSIFCSRF